MFHIFSRQLVELVVWHLMEVFFLFFDVDFFGVTLAAHADIFAHRHAERTGDEGCQAGYRYGLAVYGRTSYTHYNGRHTHDTIVRA